MLEGQDLIVFSDDWGGHPFSCQHIVQRLLPANRVLWVNSVGYRSIKLNLYDARRAVRKVASWFRPPAPGPAAPAGLHVISPVFLPFGRQAWCRAANARSAVRAVRDAAARLGFRQPVVLTTLPTTGDFVGRLGARLVVYYCVDDVTLWPGVHGRLAEDLERRLLDRSDLVVATSARLQETRRNGRTPTRLLTHGVDIEHFRALRDRDEWPAGPPVIGYYGLVDERSDRDLLLELARRLPDARLRILGTWRVPPGPLAAQPNVEIPGAVPYAELPARLTDVRVLVLPYHNDELARSINPLKLKEYLATGIPVVATPLPEVLRLVPHVRVASGADDFVAAVREALAAPPGVSPALAALLAGETWEQKARTFGGMIEEALGAVAC